MSTPIRRPIAVYTTVASEQEAQALARAVVERRLAACAQIWPIESYYVWDGSLQHDHEYRILFKTTDEHYGAVETAIRELHAYELPSIHAVAMAHVYAPFAEWIAEGSAGP
jgi:periplasmic divalent cation tolerance protein